MKITCFVNRDTSFGSIFIDNSYTRNSRDEAARLHDSGHHGQQSTRQLHSGEGETRLSRLDKRMIYTRFYTHTLINIVTHIRSMREQ